MKKIRNAISLAIISCISIVASCTDEDALQKQIDDLDARVSALEMQNMQMNNNIASLQTIISALQENDYIISVTPVTENDEIIGYTIEFAKNDPINIYFGTDGKDGTDGHSPHISVRKDIDGIYYWVLDDEWLTDEEGKKLKVTGTPPEMEIVNDRWMLSTDGGKNWEDIGQATGETLFEYVDVSDSDVTFTMSDGQVFSVRRNASLYIRFNTDDLVVMSTNSTREIGYTIGSESETITIEVMSSADIKAKIKKTDVLTGSIVVNTGTSIDEYSKVIVLVSDSNQIIMKSISFEETGLTVTENTVKEISSRGGTVDLEFLSNTECYVEIPETEQNWISVAETKSMVQQCITLAVAEETEGVNREANVRVIAYDSSLSITYTIKQEGYDTSPIIQFKDPYFLQSLLRTYTITTAEGVVYSVDIDKNDDGQISEREAAAVEVMSVSNSDNLQDISEIKYFTSLKHLLCGYNSSITVLDLSANTALEFLDCEYNEKLSVVNLNGNTALNTLYCLGNSKLTSLDVSNNTALTYLNCSNNQLSAINIGNNTTLTDLDCSGNQISMLDISNNTVLTYLKCRDNQISALDISSNPALTYLDCWNNQISEINISGHPALTYLNCSYNQISKIDVSNNTALTDLWCSYNQITTIDVSNNTALTHLNCDRNQLTTLDVSNNPALTQLFCGGNQLTALDVSNNVALTTLTCDYNQLTTIAVSNNPALTYLYCDRNQLTALDVSSNTALTHLRCQQNQISTLDVKNNTALTELLCYSNQLTALDVSNNTALTDLRCNSNQLTALDVSNNTALTYLSCSGELTTLDVSNNTALTTLYCGHNQLTTLDVSNNTALTQLRCDNNQLTELDVSNNTALTSLICSNNQLKTLDLSNNPALRSLNCSGNNLLKTIILCRDYLPEFQSTVNQLKKEYTVKFAE